MASAKSAPRAPQERPKNTPRGAAKTLQSVLSMSEKSPRVPRVAKGGFGNISGDDYGFEFPHYLQYNAGEHSEGDV